MSPKLKVWGLGSHDETGAALLTQGRSPADEVRMPRNVTHIHTDIHT